MCVIILPKNSLYVAVLMILTCVIIIIIRTVYVADHSLIIHYGQTQGALDVDT